MHKTFTHSSLHTQLALGKMSQCREDVYLAATGLMAWHGHCLSVPFSVAQCACVYFWLWCVLSLTDVGLWEMPVYHAALIQTYIGPDIAEPAVWQACDRLELVLNDFLSSITLPKHWTCHLPFPFPLHGHRALCYSQMEHWLHPTFCSV